MNTDDNKLERQIALVKKFYPDRDSLWSFFSTLEDNHFIFGCMRDSNLDHKVNTYLHEKKLLHTISSTEWLYMWEVFAMIKYVSRVSASEKEKFNKFEEQFKNL